MAGRRAEYNFIQYYIISSRFIVSVWGYVHVDYMCIVYYTRTEHRGMGITESSVESQM